MFDLPPGRSICSYEIRPLTYGNYVYLYNMKILRTDPEEPSSFPLGNKRPQAVPADTVDAADQIFTSLSSGI